MFSRSIFKSDRRRRTRRLVNTSVRLFTKSGVIEAVGVNISDVGMCLFTVANLPVGSEILAELPLENAERTRIRARIRYRALYLYGVEFHPDPDTDSQDQQIELKPIASPVDSLSLD